LLFRNADNWEEFLVFKLSCLVLLRPENTFGLLDIISSNSMAGSFSILKESYLISSFWECGYSLVTLTNLSMGGSIMILLAFEEGDLFSFLFEDLELLLSVLNKFKRNGEKDSEPD